MAIKEVHYLPAYHYELQTYVEKRETNWTYAPHKGGSINGPSHGRAPLPWDIVEEPVSMFKVIILTEVCIGFFCLYREVKKRVGHMPFLLPKL